MKETPQEYITRVLGYLEGKEPLEVLAGSPKKLAKLIKGIGKKKMGKRPSPEKWSITEILAHLADTEIVQGFRIRLILGASGTPIQGFDQDEWARYSDYANHDPELSLDAYRLMRERTVRLLKSLPPDAWERYGMHSERGKETVKRVTEMMAGHDLNHLKAIKEILQG